jgi:hypothetical protein
MYLAYQTVMIASAVLMSAAANMRADWVMSRSRTVAWSRRVALNWTSELPEKNSAVSVCSALRAVEVFEP